ncbi:MAG: TonB-dependent receptor [Acidobacteriota bacterium]|nr:TonB-dependent receptor [Acidobacteriota bacterium]
MLKLLLLLSNLALFAGFVEQTEIRITSSDVTSFQEWVLKLDNDQTFPFDKSGMLSISIPEDSITFEVVDTKGSTRFIGTWQTYPQGKPINITIAGAGISLHQVVSASRIQQSSWEVAAEVAVLSPAEQPERALAQTSDLLKEEAEVLLQKTNLGGGSPIMRGMSGNRVLLMVDGFRLNNATFRLGLNQYLNTVPGGQLEQIEVMSGPSGVQYGSDGLGGTIHLRSGDPASVSNPNNIGYHGFWSTADGTNTHQVSAHGTAGNLFVSGHFRANQYEDLEAGGAFGEQPATGYDSWDGSVNLTYKLDEARRLRLINTVSDARNVPRTDRILSGRDLLWEYHPQKLRFHGLRYESRFKDNALIDFMDLGAGLMIADEGTRRISSGSPDRLTESFTAVDTFQFNGTFTKIGEKVQWVWGFDSQIDTLDGYGNRIDLNSGAVTPEPGKFPNDSDYTSYGVFLSPVVHLTETQDLRLGLRQTWVNLTGTLDQPIGAVDENYEQLTPSVSWSYTGNRHFVSLGISQGFRAPNLEDALSLGPSNSGFDAPNPGLQPESMWSYELNYRLRGNHSMFQISTYTGRYTDLIERVPGTWLGQDTFEGEPVFILDNVGEAQIDGVSVQYNRNIGKHSLRTDATWTYGQQTDQGVPMRRIPPLRGNLGWTYDSGKWRLTGLFTWADRQDRLSPGDINDNRIPEGGTPGYGAVHLRGHYRFTDRVSLNLSAENLTDKLYKIHGSGIYEPGRRLILELDAKLF